VNLEDKKIILQHYQNPRYKDDSIQGKEYFNPSCGDFVIFDIKNNNNTIQIYFTGEGCSLSLSCASLLSEYYFNQKKEDILQSLQAINKAIEEKAETPHLLKIYDNFLQSPVRKKCITFVIQALQERISLC